MAIVNNDEESELINNFEEYIEKNANIVEIEKDERNLQDALFYREVQYILIIPENYTNNFLENKNPEIEIRKTKDSYSTYMEMIINRYLKIANIYTKIGMSQGEIVEKINEDIQNETEIIVQNEAGIIDASKPALFYNFANYCFLAIAIYIISILMNLFNEQTIKRKNQISSMPYNKIMGQLLMGNFIFALGIWAFYVLVSFVLYKSTMMTMNGLLLIISSLIFMIVSVIIGFLVGAIVKNKNAISGIVNVVALGLSFISGCFVPQQWLNEGVLNFAKFFPSYWYINVNTKIAQLTKFDFESLKPIFSTFLIILGFGLIYLIIIGIVNKRKNKHKINRKGRTRCE